jgi:hypothetical protein
MEAATVRRLRREITPSLGSARGNGGGEECSRSRGRIREKRGGRGRRLLRVQVLTGAFPARSFELRLAARVREFFRKRTDVGMRWYL